MRSLIRIVAVLAALVAGYYAYQTLVTSEEDRVRAALDELAATVSQSGEGLTQMTRAAKIGSFFTDDVVIDIGSGFAPIRGRGTVMALAAKAQIPGEGLDVRFVDVEIAFDGGGSTAVAHLTATVRGRGVGDLQALDAKELEMGLRLVDGEWTIDRVTGVEAIQRPR